MGHSRSLALVLVFGLLVTLSLPLAAGGLSRVRAASSPQIVHVSIINGAGITRSSPGYSPNEITVVIGVNNTVVWTDDDTKTDSFGYLPNHTVHANDSSFTSASMSGGESFNYTFTTQGTYAYHCDIHPWMKGTVVVKGSVVPEFPAPVAVFLTALVLAVMVLGIAKSDRIGGKLPPAMQK
jgi:plastocyanin